MPLEGYLREATIAARVTGAGGAVSIVRVSGKEAFAFGNALCGLGVAPEPGRLRRTLLQTRTGATIDRGMSVFFRGPRSFTGEDIVEFHLHGGEIPQELCLRELFELGARPALPGEFSFRAFRNGRIGLEEAQAIADLVGARGQAAAEMALERMDRGRAGRFEGIASRLRESLALCEAAIDFSDQDIDESQIGEIKVAVSRELGVLRGLASGFERGKRIQEGVRVVIAGLPNAGKSSLFNALLGEDRSIVTPVPGTTRDVIRERLVLPGGLGGIPLLVSDTAGLRQSEDDAESIGVGLSKREIADCDVVVLAVEPGTDAKLLETEWEKCGAPGEKSLGVLTKSDLDRVSPPGMRLGIRDWIPASSTTGEGIGALAIAIGERARELAHREPGEILLTRLDQKRQVESAAENLDRALGAHSLELLVADLRSALAALAPLVGETMTEDVLSAIFSRFCIGK